MESELNGWALEFEDTLYSLLKAYMEGKVKGIKVTQDEESSGSAVFPTLLVRQIGALESARTNEAKTINAIRPTFQVTITNKGERSKIKNIAEYAVSFFKLQSFEVSNPITTISDKVRTITFRATRVIGNTEHLDQL
nr:MAG TPA: hypothetical protein [Caudoviricetes sp.]